MSIPKSIKGSLVGLLVWGAFALAPYVHSDSQSLPSVLSELVDSGKVLGAQAVLAENDQILIEQYLGVRSAVDPTPIDSSTQFCIGSCSKPFASATLMALAQQDLLQLETPINGMLPQFQKPQLANNGKPTTAPSLLELLSHRGGIYSQKRGMNRRQARWIRDFQLTLADSVSGIAQEKLIFVPGTEYAYSGAGYCVLGRVAEVATGMPFESLFQENIARPLALTRTTYFPNPKDPNIATGSVQGKMNESTPHFSQPFRLPLIGGSLYSTARETSRFVRMIIERGRFGNQTILEREAYQVFTSLPFDGQQYGLGWSVKWENNRPVEVSHNGSLASSRATIRVNLNTGKYAIVYYTLTDPSVSGETGRSVYRAVIEAVKRR